MHCNVTPDVTFWGEGVYSTTIDSELRNDVKKFSKAGGGSFNNFFMLNSEMKDLH